MLEFFLREPGIFGELSSLDTQDKLQEKSSHTHSEKFKHVAKHAAARHLRLCLLIPATLLDEDVDLHVQVFNPVLLCPPKR